VRSADVAHEFERFGQLVRVDIPLRNGKSKGFAFVEFIYKQDCENALTATKGRLRIDGKPVTIELTQRDFAPVFDFSSISLTHCHPLSPLPAYSIEIS
jgi:RNA recognition motif-containing protein